MEDLAREVILQAIRDATLKTTKYRNSWNPTKRDKVQAIKFLSGRGEYEIWLKFWCALAEIDFGAVKRFGEKIKERRENGGTFKKTV